MTTLTLDAVKKSGGFAPKGLTKKTITIKDDNDEDVSFDVYVKHLSYASVINARGADGEDRADAVARNISDAIRDEEGGRIFTPGDITGESDPERGPISSELTIALLSAIGEVSAGKKKAKSRKKKSSGTS